MPQPNIRPTRTSHLRSLVNNLWADSEELSSPPLTPRPRRRMARGQYSRSGTVEEFNVSIASMSMDSDADSSEGSGSEHEPKTDPAKSPSKIPGPRLNLNPPAEQPQSLVASEDTTAAETLQEESHMPIIEKNRLWPIEEQYKMLESLQSNLVQSLESLDPQESQRIGSYKCIPLVLDECSKCVLNLPAESVQDLQDRCQAANESGYMLLYDQLERVQLANDEFEASQQKGKLLVSLKDFLLRKHNELMKTRILWITKNHNELMNRLQADLEVKLKAEQENFNSKVEELQKMLSDLEAQRDEYKRQLKNKESTIESIMAESKKNMSLNMNLADLLKESSAELVQTRKDLVESREHIAYLEGEWNEEHEHLLKLQIREDVMEDKDQIIADLMLTVQQLKDMQHDPGESRSRQSMQQVLSDMEHLKSELYQSQQLVSEMRAQANHDHRIITRWKEEIQICRLKDTESLITYQKLYLESADKDMQINELQHKLDSKEEQLSHAFEKQALQAEAIRRLEEITKMSSKENARIAYEREQYQEAIYNGKQQVEKLTKQLAEFVDFLLNKGKPPAIIEHLIHVCRRCGCIHKRVDKSGYTEASSESRVCWGNAWSFLEPLHNQIAQQQEQLKQQKEQQDEPNGIRNI